MFLDGSLLLGRPFGESIGDSFLGWSLPQMQDEFAKNGASLKSPNSNKNPRKFPMVIVFP